MNAGACVCIHLFKHTQTKHVTHNTVHGNVDYRGDTCILGIQVDHDNVYNTGKKRCVLKYCRCCISLNRPTAAATGPHIMCVLSFLCRNLHDDSVFRKLQKKTLFHVWFRPFYLAINWAIWSMKFMWSCICLIGDWKRTKYPLVRFKCAHGS